MARKEDRSAAPAPRHAPRPERPEEVWERFRRGREGRATAARRRLARLFGVEKISPARQVLVVSVATVEIFLMGLGLFTDLPVSWLVTAALALAPMLLHLFDKRKAGKNASPAKDATLAGDADRTKSLGRTMGKAADREHRKRRKRHS